LKKNYKNIPYILEITRWKNSKKRSKEFHACFDDETRFYFYFLVKYWISQRNRLPTTLNRAFRDMLITYNRNRARIMSTAYNANRVCTIFVKWNYCERSVLQHHIIILYTVLYQSLIPNFTCKARQRASSVST
jgi:hypothetical protein